MPGKGWKDDTLAPSLRSVKEMYSREGEFSFLDSPQFVSLSEEQTRGETRCGCPPLSGSLCP